MQDSLGAPVDYPMWGRLDYPSIGLVDAKLREFDIIPIFSSVQQFEETYTVRIIGTCRCTCKHGRVEALNST